MIEEDFNSQPHKEADSVSIKPCAHFVRFQLTASQGGWLIKSVIAVSNTYFNSQPHKEADLSLLNCLNRSNISTHSLTRRLTESDNLLPKLEIFQLTASQGGWRIDNSIIHLIERFQLTASQGGWPSLPFFLFSSFVFQLTASQGGWP